MKKVVITGCSTGLGRQMAQLGRTLGWEVLASVRNESAKQPLEALGCTVVQLELKESESVQQFIAAIHEWSEGHLDGLINNAGVVLVGPLEYLERNQLREQFEINVFGHLELTRGVLPQLRQAGGKIVMLSSVSSELTFPLYGPYSASKRALEAFTEALAMELSPQGIQVAIVQPGSHASSIWEKCKNIG